MAAVKMQRSTLYTVGLFKLKAPVWWSQHSLNSRLNICWVVRVSETMTCQRAWTNVQQGRCVRSGTQRACSIQVKTERNVEMLRQNLNEIQHFSTCLRNGLSIGSRQMLKPFDRGLKWLEKTFKIKTILYSRWRFS